MKEEKLMRKFLKNCLGGILLIGGILAVSSGIMIPIASPILLILGGWVSIITNAFILNQ